MFSSHRDMVTGQNHNFYSILLSVRNIYEWSLYISINALKFKFIFNFSKFQQAQEKYSVILTLVFS